MLVLYFFTVGIFTTSLNYILLVLGSTARDFSGQQIKKCDDVDLLGIIIDCKLSFNKHISSICSKVNKQLSVIKRFKHLRDDHIKRRL